MLNLRFLILCAAAFLLTGCASVLKKEDILLEAQKIKASVSTPSSENTPTQEPLPASPIKVSESLSKPITPPLPQLAEDRLSEHEKLIFKAKYLGLTIGEFIIINNGKALLNGQSAYHFELISKTLPFFSALFGAKDRYVSYMDTKKFIILRHEEYIKGGSVLESTVDFDYATHSALYTNHINGRVKKTPIPDKIFDVICGGFYLRTLPLDLGDTAEFDLYADEKVYNFIGLMASRQQAILPNQPAESAYLFKPYVFHEGKQIKKVSADVLLSTSSKIKKPLHAILKTPLGNVSVSLENSH